MECSPDLYWEKWEGNDSLPSLAFSQKIMLHVVSHAYVLSIVCSVSLRISHLLKYKMVPDGGCFIISFCGKPWFGSSVLKKRRQKQTCMQVMLHVQLLALYLSK